jgi:arylsulfatase A-like enzyme
MKRLALLILLCVLASALWQRSAPICAAEARPNIVFLFADDLGYGDVGPFGQTKIRTPNIDQLAKQGMRLTQCYAGNAVCAPSRCVLMTGLHPGHAQVRNNREIQPEGQHPLKAGTVTLPRLLQQLGYVTGGFGKWGLGGPDSDGRPTKQGIDRWFGYNCQRKAHSHYPPYLWDNETKFPLKNPQNPPLTGHEKIPDGADPNDDKSYAGLAGAEFGMDVITEQAVKFVHDNKARPFFLYYPTIIPHAAFQVPEDSLVEYKGKFPEERPYLSNYTANRTPRATFAAMVTRMDRHIGQIIAAVREDGLEDNTIFVFSSDNGPVFDTLSGESVDFFNSTAGFRGRKGSLYEAGIHEPTIVAWKGHIAAGSTSDRVCGFEDWMPTLLELVGGKETTPKDIDGVSFAPTLFGKSQPQRPFLYREFVPGGGQQSVRIGDWKGIRQNMMGATGKAKAKNKNKADAAPTMHIELYDLKNDPHETKDVSADHADTVAKIAQLMREQHTPNADFPFPALENP